MIPATITTKAPVGPPIWTFDPPRNGDQEAADDGRVDAGLRGDAGGDAERHGQGQCDESDGDAGNQVGNKITAAVSRKHGP